MNIYQTLEPRTLDEIIALGCIMIDNAVEKIILKHEAEMEWEKAPVIEGELVDGDDWKEAAKETPTYNYDNAMRQRQAALAGLHGLAGCQDYNGGLYNQQGGCFGQSGLFGPSPFWR